MVMFMGHEVHTVGIRDGISRVTRRSIWARDRHEAVSSAGWSYDLILMHFMWRHSSSREMVRIAELPVRNSDLFEGRPFRIGYCSLVEHTMPWLIPLNNLLLSLTGRSYVELQRCPIADATVRMRQELGEP